jgi:hypothetical protein
MKVKYEMKKILYGINSGGSLAIVARRRLRHKTPSYFAAGFDCLGAALTSESERRRWCPLRATTLSRDERASRRCLSAA